jgi:hypothetical protein
MAEQPGGLTVDVFVVRDGVEKLSGIARDYAYWKLNVGPGMLRRDMQRDPSIERFVLRDRATGDVVVTIERS